MELEHDSSTNAQASDGVGIANSPPAYAFTVHFNNGKENCIEETGKLLSRRHTRNLSLPVSKVYENKMNNEIKLNGKSGKKAGNHSEGYFSSDPDDDSKPKLFEVKLKNPDHGGFKGKCPTVSAMSVTCENEKEEDVSSDIASETGTYTIDKDSPDVTIARKSIDSVFGVQDKASKIKKNEVNGSQTNSTWVSEWASSVVKHNSHTNLDSGTSRNNGSKIPSPVNNRQRLSPMTEALKGDYHEHVRGSLNCKSNPVAAQEICALETESYLRTTERVVSALAARVSLSLDSGGESDAENSLGQIVEPPVHTDCSISDSGHTMRYNRAFSLRRGILEDTKKKDTTSIINKVKGEPVKSISTRINKRESLPFSSPSFSRTDCGRFSMRLSRPLPQSPIMSNTKKEVIKKKSGNGGSARSNSTLSSKEVEFQNWKRRKSYDPMKAAAEGKKKEAAKKQPSSAMTQSTNSTITTPKSPVNPVLRSASFHGTRQLTTSSSDEEEEEITLSAEDEDWPPLQVPRTSLENTPQGSRVSLYSNTSNSPTPPLGNRPKFEGVDTLVISALSGLSSKLKGSSCNLLNKLRILYDEDSPKHHQLAAMVDQCEVSEPGSPQVKSPSRELANTLRNLKRLESMLKVLDEVLFDEEDFQ